MNGEILCPPTRANSLEDGLLTKGWETHIMYYIICHT